MKDIIIKASRIKREVFLWFLIFLAANILNVYAIIRYSGEWSELVTQLHIIVLLSVALYLAFSLIRLTIHGIKRLFFPKRGFR
ncbi:hypothetical protein QLX67_01380 [Balneolaceae bacterium ANBcel3]|nr:hypothetical protein [Balneolaceae bacterium ANBcel3]